MRSSCRPEGVIPLTTSLFAQEIAGSRDFLAFFIVDQKDPLQVFHQTELPTFKERLKTSHELLQQQLRPKGKFGIDNRNVYSTGNGCVGDVGWIFNDADEEDEDGIGQSSSSTRIIHSLNLAPPILNRGASYFYRLPELPAEDVEVVLDSSSTWEQFIVTAEDESVSRAYYVDPCLFVFTESVPNEGISKIVKISKSDWYKHVEENGYYRDGDYHRYDYSCHIREYQEADAEQLQLAADHAAIASRLRPGFPSPYTLADARGWIQLVRDDQAFAGRTFAVIVGGAIAGGVGLVPVPEIQLGEEDRAHGEELGYWITPACWGQGVGSSAVAQFVALVQSSRSHPAFILRRAAS